jgi:hypothetical protein
MTNIRIAIDRCLLDLQATVTRISNNSDLSLGIAQYLINQTPPTRYVVAGLGGDLELSIELLVPLFVIHDNITTVGENIAEEDF